MEELFREHSIVGIYPDQITEDLAYKTGRAIALYFLEQEIVVGRDMRIGSDKLSASLIKGITDQGKTAIDIGLCSMPVFVFATQQVPGVIVTSPHYTKTHNGFTICSQGGSPLSLPNGLSEIKKLLEENKFSKLKKRGKSRKRDVMGKYVKHVRSFKGKLKKLKVVIDAGNGMAGHVVPKVFNRLVKVIPLFFELDGTFPNRNPRPTKETLSALIKEVKKNKANLGIAYDSDCDRVVFVDERGILIKPDFILALLAQQIIKKNPYAKVLYDVRCSRVVKEYITKLGGVPVMTRIGTTFMNETMQDEDALLGGETTSHYYFRDNFHSDNGDIAVIMIMSLISEERKPLSKLAAPLHKYFGSEEIKFVSDGHESKLKKAEKMYGSKGQVYNIDGLSIEFKDWWFNVRPKDNELLLVVEANTKSLLDRKVAELKRILS